MIKNIASFFGVCLLVATFSDSLAYHCEFWSSESTVTAVDSECVHDKYQYLNANKYFQTINRKSEDWVKEAFKDDGGKRFKVSTSDGFVVGGYYFDRGSDEVIIAAPGAFGTSEELAHFVGMFEDKDLILFDFRWKNLVGYTFSNLALWRPFKKMFFDEIKDVLAVLAWAGHQKDYRRVVGLGMCYSAMLFVMAQTECNSVVGMHGFDALILDSCGVSFEDFAGNMTQDPWLSRLGGRGGAPGWIKSFMGSSVIKFPAIGLVKLLSPKFCLCDELKKIGECELLFIHGKGDDLVSWEDKFVKLWAATSGLKKSALLTPFEHTVSSLKAKEMFCHVAKQFVNGAVMTSDALF